MPFLIILTDPYTPAGTLKHVTDYVGKNGFDNCGGWGLDPQYAYEYMELVKKSFYKEDSRQVRHYIQAFAPTEKIKIDQALKFGMEICQYYSDFQCIFGYDPDIGHPHLHFCMNTVSFVDGHRYSGGKDDWFKFRDYVQSLMPEWCVDLKIKSSQNKRCTAGTETGSSHYFFD